MKFRASLAETPLKDDPTSGQTAQQLPTYNAYSIDGDVTAPLVYVNYGVPDDYERLERLGVDVRGKIVIARYGGGWRGIKPKVAAEHGARRLPHLLRSRATTATSRARSTRRAPGARSRASQRGSVADMPLVLGRSR